MAIPYQTIVKQMINRLEDIKYQVEDRDKLLQQIYYIHGLCELIIEEEKKSLSVKKQKEQVENKQPLNKLNDHDTTSLLDF